MSRGRAHAIARRAGVARLAGFRDDALDFHQLRGRQARLVVHRLAAIRAIFRTATGFDAQKTAELNPVRVEVFAVHGLRPEQQVVERQVVER